MTPLDNKQHPQEIYIHAPSEIRTRNPNKQAAAGPRLDGAAPRIGLPALYELYLSQSLILLGIFS
jgi:hypothetical protein